MKVLHIITGLGTGGAENMLYKLLRHIDRNCFDPQVISLTGHGDFSSRIKDLNIPVIALGMRPGIPNPIKILFLFKILRSIKPDIVSTWMYHADLLGGIAARLSGTRLICWNIRSGNYMPQKKKNSTLIVMKTCAFISRWLPKRVLSCSKKALSIHVDAGYCADKIKYIPNGFSSDLFFPDFDARTTVRRELGLPANTFLVGLIARNDPVKNHMGFIKSAAQVHRALPAAHFLLVGLGIDTNNTPLIQAIKNEGLTKVFHLLGQRNDIPHLMAGLDVLVSCSFGEAFSNVLGEAMACGVPCVATDVGDSAEIIGNTGRIVPPGDVEGLANYIIEILEMPRHKRESLGRLARKRIQEHYDINDITRKYERLYIELLEAP